MRLTRYLFFVPALMVAAACGRDDGATDASLDNDLRLAGQPYSSMDSISMMERQNAQGQLVTPRRATSTPARTTTRTTSSGTASGSATRSAPVVVTRKNTGRDAAIGATAGAVIGATTSRDRVKGGLIGAAIGGIAGAVIGNNVDVRRDTVRP